jgi:predicted nucleotidyltransferase
MQLTEEQLISWSKPVSKTEDEKCQNAINIISEIIKNKFGNNIKIYLQGSYQNDTNVRRDSDVDIVVEYTKTFYPELDFLTDPQKEVFHSYTKDSDYTFSQFKLEVLQTLEGYFGKSYVKRKDKCIYVIGNSYRINADVVPCFTLKRYKDSYLVSAEGIKFYSDSNIEITSYPKQHYNNGVSKNNNTNRMYKRMVRILKNIRNKLIETNTITDKLVSSFLIECLVYNAPTQLFTQNNYLVTLKNLIIRIYNDMSDPDKALEYEEVSGLKWLFKGGKRSPADTKLFMQKCWEYAGF